MEGVAVREALFTCQRGLDLARSNASSHDGVALAATLSTTFCGGGTPPSRGTIATLTLGPDLSRAGLMRSVDSSIRKSSCERRGGRHIR